MINMASYYLLHFSENVLDIYVYLYLLCYEITIHDVKVSSF
jgi:hypothetical protein